VSRIVPSFVLVALVTTASAVASAPTTREIAIYDGLVRFELPDDWREIAPTDLDELTMWAASATAGQSVEVYQYGYVPPEFESDPWLPHMLVQIRESGRISYGRFLHLPPLEDLRQTSRGRFPQGLPPLVMGVAVERAGFDASTFTIRLEHALDLRFKGPVRVQTAAFLTERGLVAFHFIDRKARIEEGRALFDAIVDGVTIDPALAYRPRLLDRWPGLPYFVAAGITALALMAYIVHRRSAP
jgi:hypothetical protein